MLSPKVQTNLANAKSYFKEHLELADYYTEGAESYVQWRGKGAARLNLSGTVRMEDFVSLCENRNPQTGERLTQRHKDKVSEDGAKRRIFYDFVFSPPKSVSVAALVLNDSRVVKAHAHAVETALAELESFTQTRVRIGGEMSDRRTGNFIAATFQHETSRALDPHLHTHCTIFNATFDPVEERWKALQNNHMLKARKLIEGLYYHELASALRAHGYTILNSKHGDFELGEICKTTRDRFSKRHDQIDKETEALLKRRASLRGRNIKNIRENISYQSRPSKTHVPKDELRQHWLEELTNEERAALKLLIPSTDIPAIGDAKAAVDWAEAHLFERRTVVGEHEIWRYALERLRGTSVPFESVKAETLNRPEYVRFEDGFLTLRSILECEQAVVALAKEGRSTCSRFVSSKLNGLEAMSEEQSKALEKILSSRDFITLFRGGAGTGKSYLLKRVQTNLEKASGTFVIAPQRQQVIDLARDGFANTQTVSEFLQRKPLKKGSTVIVDEAGQIGIKQMRKLLTYAKQSECRVILSGDTRQHGPVECGDALRAIERHAGCQIAELETIRRQDPALGSDADEKLRITRYRDAVKAAANSSLAESFNILEQSGAIRECLDMAPALSESYLKHVKSGETALVVSQTRDEVKRVNDIIRNSLKREAHLQGDEMEVIALEQVDLTEAQKLDARYYPENAVIVLNRDARGFVKGQTGKVLKISSVGAVVECDEKIKLVPPHKIDALTICQPNTLTLCRGDRIQLKANGKAINGEKLANGEVVTIRRVLKSGEIKLEDGRILAAYFRQFVRGYAVTSYGSQGKTVDHVIFADSAVAAATNAHQWYVTISRGRKSVVIQTADKKELRSNILRESGCELVIEPRIEGTDSWRKSWPIKA